MQNRSQAVASESGQEDNDFYKNVVSPDENSDYKLIPDKLVVPSNFISGKDKTLIGKLIFLVVQPNMLPL
jgi:hypothetical protein